MDKLYSISKYSYGIEESTITKETAKQYIVSDGISRGGLRVFKDDMTNGSSRYFTSYEAAVSALRERTVRRIEQLERDLAKERKVLEELGQ